MVCPLRHSDGAAIIAVESILCAFAIAAVVLRIWARRLKGIRLQASDWVCIAGLVGWIFIPLLILILMRVRSLCPLVSWLLRLQVSLQGLCTLEQ